MMWALRVGSSSRWKGKDAAKVAKDLDLREGEEGLSVFWVDANKATLSEEWRQSLADLKPPR